MSTMTSSEAVSPMESTTSSVSPRVSPPVSPSESPSASPSASPSGSPLGSPLGSPSVPSPVYSPPSIMSPTSTSKRLSSTSKLGSASFPNPNNKTKGKSKLMSLFQKGSPSCPVIPSPPPPPPAKSKIARGPSLNLPTHLAVTIMFPADGWVLDLKIAKCATSENIWNLISQHHKIDEQDMYGIFTEKGIMMSEHEPVIHFKVKNKDLLTIKPRLKKDVKVHVKSVLNTFLKRRPEQIDIARGSKSFKIAGENERSPRLSINTALFHLCIQHLINIEAHKTEGIFRLSPSAIELSVFYNSMMNDEEPDFSVATSPHTIAGGVKQYLRSLSTALIFNPTSSMMAQKMKDCVNDKDKLIRELTILMSKLPMESIEVLGILFGFLLLVVNNTEYSKMTSRNLSIVFGPNVISFEDTMDALTQAQIGTEIVDIIISNWENIYGRLSAFINR